MQGFQLRNYKWEWIGVDENSKDKTFKPVKDVRVFSKSFDSKNADFIYQQTVAKYVLRARDFGNTRADVATTDYMLAEA